MRLELTNKSSLSTKYLTFFSSITSLEAVCTLPLLVFLENCAAFGALGRMFVIRCSDFCNVDQIIMDAAEKEDTTSSNSVDGGSVLKDAVECVFLFEQDDIENRNLHSHISLSAFINLVEYGFSDPIKTEDLQSSIKKIDFQVPLRPRILI